MGDEAASRVEALDLLPVGSLAPGALAAVAARLSRHVELPCHPRPPRPDLSLRRLPGRPQVDAGALLETLRSEPRPPERVVVGLTGDDLGVPIFTFVFGLARAGAGVTIVSLARLDPTFYGLPPDPDRRDQRAVAEIRHELGHVCGLDHCADRNCLMSFAGTIEKADARGGRFCRACGGKIPRWLLGPSAPPSSSTSEP